MEQEKKKRGRPAAVKASDGAQTNVHSIRMSDETHNALGTVKQALGASTTEEALKVMLDSFSMTQAKEALPERSTEISEFEAHCRRLIDTYTHSLLLCHDAETRAREAVKEELERKDQVISQLSYMQTQTDNHIQKLKDAYDKLTADFRQVVAERDALATELATIKKAEHTDADLSARFDALQKVLEAVVAGRAQ